MMAMGIHRARSAAKSRSQATRCGTSGAPSQRKTQTILPRPNEVMAGSRQNSPTSPQWASFVQGAIKDSEWKLPASSSFKAAFQYIQAIYLSDFKSIFISIFKSFHGGWRFPVDHGIPIILAVHGLWLWYPQLISPGFSTRLIRFKSKGSLRKLYTQNISKHLKTMWGRPKHEISTCIGSP